MSSLTEIEAAVVRLPVEDKQRLLRLITASLDCEDVQMPEPRDFSIEQIQEWIARDEEAMRRFREGK